MSDVAPLPPWVDIALDEGEVVLWAKTPIRRAGGPLGVYSIMGGGIVFTFASGVAFAEMAGRYTLGMSVGRVMLLALLMALCALWLAFSLMMLVWPLLSGWAMRNQMAVITNKRVLHIRRRMFRAQELPRIKATPLLFCTEASVVRRRGPSATLVLSENLKERPFDGRTVYEWNCIHGLPDADQGLQTLFEAQAALRAHIAQGGDASGVSAEGAFFVGGPVESATLDDLGEVGGDLQQQ